jgi:acetyltransferase
MPSQGNLALISQSGAIAAGMVDWAAQRGVGFSGIVSIGDQLDVDIADLLDYFALDSGTRAILLYVEAIKDARKFMSAARAAARIKPVVVVKSGRMAQGAKAAATHTGALAGSDSVYDAAFRRAGILRVSDLRELFDCAETLGRGEQPQGKRLAILTNGGGIGVLAIDRLVELGGIPAAIEPATREKLDAVLPRTWSGSNPVDIVGDADAARYAAALKILLADTGNDALLVMNVQTAIAPADEIAATVTDVVSRYRQRCLGSAKPVLAVLVGADQKIIDMLSGAGIPNYPTEDDAVRGFMHLARHREVVAALAQVPPAMPGEFVPDSDTTRQIVAAALAEGRHWLDPVEIVRLLEVYQIPMVPAFAAADAEQAGTHASSLFAQRATAVRAATADILARAKTLRPEARIAGVIVQAMVVRPKARELIVGFADDPTFGTVSYSAAAARQSRSSTTRRLRFRRSICNWLGTSSSGPASHGCCLLTGTCPRLSPTPSRWFWSSWRRWPLTSPRYANWTSIPCWRMNLAYWQWMRASPSDKQNESLRAQALPISRCGHIHHNGSGTSKSRTAGGSLCARFAQRTSRRSMNYCGTSPARICGSDFSRR